MKIAELSLSKLLPSEENPREALRDLESLAASIRGFGILEPLIVLPAAGMAGFYRIIAGHRRAQAAALAGLQTAPCVIRKDLARADLGVLHLVENTQRDDLLPVEIGIAVFAALKARRIKQKDLAAQLGRSEPWVSKHRTIGEAAAKIAARLEADSDPADPLGDIDIEELPIGTRDGEEAYQIARHELGLDKPQRISRVPDLVDAAEQSDPETQTLRPDPMPVDLERRIPWLAAKQGLTPSEFKFDVKRNKAGGSVALKISFDSNEAAETFFRLW